jgi:hypothetical protein
MPCHEARPETKAQKSDEHADQLADYLTSLEIEFGIPASDTARRIKDLYWKTDIGGHIDELTAELCGKMRAMTTEQLAGLSRRNWRGSTGRHLLAWWEVHKAIDVEREKWEMDEASRMEVVHRALAKLTPQERDAIEGGTKPRPFHYGV